MYIDTLLKIPLQYCNQCSWTYKNPVMVFNNNRACINFGWSLWILWIYNLDSTSNFNSSELRIVTNMFYSLDLYQIWQKQCYNLIVNNVPSLANDPDNWIPSLVSVTSLASLWSLGKSFQFRICTQSHPYVLVHIGSRSIPDRNHGLKSHYKPRIASQKTGSKPGMCLTYFKMCSLSWQTDMWW